MDNEFSAGEHPEFSETHKTHLAFKITGLNGFSRRSVALQG
jgi:hypothetical protein